MWHEDSAANRRTGILLVSLATLSFSMLDTTVKWLLQLQTIPLIEIIWLRFLSQAVVSGVVLAPRYKGAMFRIQKKRLQLLRAVLLGTMTGCNFWSIQFLQLTETASILFSAPLIVAVISHFWLQQRLRKAQWITIITGFIGVLIVVRPSSRAIHPAIFLMVFNAVLFAIFNLLTRHLAQYENPAAMQWYSAMGPVVLFAPWALPGFVMPHNTFELVLVISAGLWGGLGHYVWARAHQYANAATLAPFNYQQLLYMAFWGWLVFGDVPPSAVFVGGSIIAASGIYLLWEQKRVPPTIPPSA